MQAERANDITTPREGCKSHRGIETMIIKGASLQGETIWGAEIGETRKSMGHVSSAGAGKATKSKTLNG